MTNTKKYLRISLAILLLFLSSGGFFGGIMLVGDPSGAGLQLPSNMLDHLPLANFLLPGLFLLIFFGFLPLPAATGLIWNSLFGFLSILNPVKKWHWASTLSLFIGIVLVGWTLGGLILWGVNFLSVVYFLLGLLIVLISSLCTPASLP
jgi:hypothetical protein